MKIASDGNIGINCTPDGFGKLKVNGRTVLDGSTFVENGGGGDFASLTVDGETGYAPLVYIKGISVMNYELWVDGESYSTQGWTSSDEQFKKNIQELNSTMMLSKLIKISGKKYSFKEKEELRQLYDNGTFGKRKNDSTFKVPSFPKGNYYGLIAQEIETEFPELVRYDSVSKTRAINYDGMIPILLEALKEQQEIIHSHEERIGALEKTIEELTGKKTKSAEAATTNEVSPSTASLLYQNSPNPFNESTVIRFVLPGTVVSATLYIYNMQGNQVKGYDIAERGFSSLEILGSELQPGMYLYTLLADGKEIDTKKMILTE
jgi:hypothetical protein